MTPSSRWIVTHDPPARPALRLFCLPYAGGGASIYRRWPGLLGSAVQVCAVQLPGRENRLDERPYTEILALVNALASAVAPLLDLPFALFGHSLGARLAYELARALRRARARQPLHVFVSGAAAPHLPPRARPIHDLPRPDFLAEVHKLGGTPDAVLEHQELMEILIPMLRADFRLDETHRLASAEPVSAPITVCAGRADRTVDAGQLAAWRQYTTGLFNLRLFEGGHFFLHSEETALVSLIQDTLRRDLGERQRQEEAV